MCLLILVSFSPSLLAKNLLISDYGYHTAKEDLLYATIKTKTIEESVLHVTIWTDVLVP
jgi:hypothetical protein